MITVANPIYDVVFKYLLEDDRIARTILSALLQKDVVELQQRRNEYNNIGRDGLSVFRIDFGATVRDSDGSTRLVLIELQKTWLETETLRFRQYLGAQYANKENMLAEKRGAYAIPMITVYLLGHKVGNIEEPVLYVRRKCYDPANNVVTKGLPDPFVDSLTHDSIIVQIPRLRGRFSAKGANSRDAKGRLEMVLSIFDQSKLTQETQQTMDIDEDDYGGDDDMMRIVHRLTAAAADSKMRHDMNVEDEYFSAIEDRDTAILLRDEEIARKATQLAERDAQLAEVNATMKERNAQLAESNAQLAESNAQLAESNAQLAESNAQLAERDAQLAEVNTRLQQQQAMISKSIIALHQAGVPAAAIATTLGVTPNEVTDVIEGINTGNQV